ncbi:MAG: hypothetical protein AB7L66_09950 [Gemmatimonadales bacterium]
MRRSFVVFLPLLIPVAAGAQNASGRERHSFSGVFATIETGRQNLIAGALVGGVDVLAQASRPVTTVGIGARIQTPFGTVFGASLGRGWGDGTLRLDDGGLTVQYRGRSRRHWELIAGQAIGPRRQNLVYAYLSEVSRSFGVTIDDHGTAGSQRDEQGLLRYGVGFERVLGRFAAVRVGVGSSRADFGNRPTNVVPRRPVDVTIGLVLAP